jgi:hypothetical protein
MELTAEEESFIKSRREVSIKFGDYWLTKKGRAEIRDTWENPNDGNIVLTLLNALEKAEDLIKAVNADLFIDGSLNNNTRVHVTNFMSQLGAKLS